MRRKLWYLVGVVVLVAVAVAGFLVGQYMARKQSIPRRYVVDTQCFTEKKDGLWSYVVLFWSDGSVSFATELRGMPIHDEKNKRWAAYFDEHMNCAAVHWSGR